MVTHVLSLFDFVIHHLWLWQEGTNVLLFEVPHPHHALCQPIPCTQAKNHMLVPLSSLRLKSQCISKFTFIVNNLGCRNKSTLYTPLQLLLVIEIALNLSHVDVQQDSVT